MNTALILSGGTGMRMGTAIPKQYMEAAGRPIITYSIERLFAHDKIDAVQIVADEMWRERLTEWIRPYDKQKKFRGFSNPGANRQLSIYHGLTDIRAYATDSDTVLIHDAARPLLTDKQISDCLYAIHGHDGVLPVLPMKDTIYTSMDGQKVHALLDRSTLFAGQAPEVFVLGKYLEANRRLLPEKILAINGSTEPAVLSGMDVVMIPGDEGNFKITTQADFERFLRIIEGNRTERNGR